MNADDLLSPHGGAPDRDGVRIGLLTDAETLDGVHVIEPSDDKHVVASALADGTWQRWRLPDGSDRASTVRDIVVAFLTERPEGGAIVSVVHDGEELTIAVRRSGESWDLAMDAGALGLEGIESSVENERLLDVLVVLVGSSA